MIVVKGGDPGGKQRNARGTGLIPSFLLAKLNVAVDIPQNSYAFRGLAPN